jgi:hypothetical protein
MTTIEPDASDAFEVREDGTTLLRFGGREVTLRRPRATEWGEYLEKLERCDAWYTQEDVPDNDRQPRKFADLLGEANPYRALYARIIADLGGTTVDVGELPTWMVDARAAIRLNAAWLTIPLVTHG